MNGGDKKRSDSLQLPPFVRYVDPRCRVPQQTAHSKGEVKKTEVEEIESCSESDDDEVTEVDSREYYICNNASCKTCRDTCSKVEHAVTCQGLCFEGFILRTKDSAVFSHLAIECLRSSSVMLPSESRCPDAKAEAS